MRVAIVVSSHGRTHQHETASRLQRGLAVHGDQSIICMYNQVPREVDAVCTWGWRIAKSIKEARPELPVLVRERAYVGDRFTWVSLGWEGLNGRAKFPVPSDDGARWRKHFAQVLKPWKWPSTAVATGYGLLIGQVPSDTACADINFARWARDTSSALLRAGWPMRFRPHPLCPGLRCGVELAPGSVVARDDRGLEEAFAAAAFVVTYNSNAGVLAALAGVPVVALDVGSMAYAIASHDTAAPIHMPDRTEWANRLAWSQWLPAELADGSAWEAVRSVIPINPQEG